MITFSCGNPACAMRLKAPLQSAGKMLACPKCKTPVRVPRADQSVSTNQTGQPEDLDTIALAVLPDIAKGEKEDRILGATASIVAQAILLLLMLILPRGSGRGLSGEGLGEVGLGLAMGEGDQLTNTDDGTLDDSAASAGGEASPDLTASAELGVAQPGDSPDGLELSIGNAEVRGGGGGGGGLAAGGDGFGFGGRAGGSGEASFLGTTARGSRFCIVADNSGSMNGPPLEFVKDEVLKTISNARGSAKFTVVFFNSMAELPPQPKWISGKAEQATLAAWVNGIHARNGTSPVRGVEMALRFDPPPDVIYLMTDGLFDPVEVQQINALNRRLKRPAQIHTIAFMQRAGEPLLRQIAQDGKGTYRFVPGY